MPSPRSPIARMVDEACGLPPGWENDPKFNPPQPTADEGGAALLEVLDAAKAWLRNRKKGAPRLAHAVKAAQKLRL